MAGRTFAIGDIHGEAEHLSRVLGRLPALDADDTLVFLGDYLDRGPRSKDIVEQLMSFPGRTPAKVVCLRGNHEDSWVRVCKEGWDEFVLAPGNGCLATVRSFTGGAAPTSSEQPRKEDMMALTTGSFFPDAVVRWLDGLPDWYEDAHAIYVHAGLPRDGDRFLHPSEVGNRLVLLWIRTEDFFRNYRGKRVVFGHTPTEFLPQEISSYTPLDPCDAFIGENVIGTDTGSGTGGFLTAVELPAVAVYESR
ncbi:MAG TPA: metallophosphoesterase [Polyangia bacterium]|jgi:serine/threonine protein phosphatase 1|nr:metallophosphoesterase [Polyangia bacterium]